MHWEEFVVRHGLKEIERDAGGNWRGVMMEMCPYDGHDEKDLRFYLNEEMNLYLVVDEVHGMYRVAYWELAPAISKWERMTHLLTVGGSGEKAVD